MHPIFLHYKLHGAPGLCESLDVADGQYAGIPEAGQDFRGVLAFRGADEEHVTTAQVIPAAVLDDRDGAPLCFLPRDDPREAIAKGVVSNDSNHDRRL